MNITMRGVQSFDWHLKIKQKNEKSQQKINKNWQINSQ